MLDFDWNVARRACEGFLKNADVSRTRIVPRAIEDVYWHHRIWPKENLTPKPSLDTVMSQTQFEKKVTDYLRKSQTLEDHWHRPITAAQLQAEMDRMAKNTKQPDVLRDLFDALGNDPFVIAECLARPALAERLLTNWYAYDQRIHGELKHRAEKELQAHPTVEQMKELIGTYTEVELIRSEREHEQANRLCERGIKLNSREWDEAVRKIAAAFHMPRDAAGFDIVPTGKLSHLQQGQADYYVTAVVDKNQGYLKLATFHGAKSHESPGWLAWKAKCLKGRRRQSLIMCFQ